MKEPMIVEVQRPCYQCVKCGTVYKDTDGAITCARRCKCLDCGHRATCPGIFDWCEVKRKHLTYIEQPWISVCNDWTERDPEEDQ